MSKESFIEFVELPPNPKTKCWRVVAKQNSGVIGSVSWYGPWRKYCFFACPSTVFEENCLRDIANFCERVSRIRKLAGEFAAKARAEASASRCARLGRRAA